MQIVDFEERPWGYYEVLLELPETKVKQITVDKGHRLSYQYHEHRDETWVVVSGKAKVTLDGKNTVVEPGQTIQIPRGTKHRVEAIGEEDLTFIEVQTGDYFGEDDITRLEDDYER
jgi:mannose-6-phosphate isomerase